MIAGVEFNAPIQILPQPIKPRSNSQVQFKITFDLTLQRRRPMSV